MHSQRATTTKIKIEALFRRYGGRVLLESSKKQINPMYLSEATLGWYKIERDRAKISNPNSPGTVVQKRERGDWVQWRSWGREIGS